MTPERLSRLQCRILAWLAAEAQRTRGRDEVPATRTCCTPWRTTRAA